MMSSTRCTFECFGGLHDELWVEILLRLPLRVLSRCKCVSKTWRRLVQTTYSQKVYLGLFHHRTPLMRDDPMKEFTIGSQEVDDHVHVDNRIPNSEIALHVTDACNGFFLLSKYPIPCNITVSNPLTGKAITLPHCNYLPEPCIAYCPMMIFDPRISPHYKVILFFGIYLQWLAVNMTWDVAIFSSETREWKHLPINLEGENNEAGLVVAAGQTVCFNGYAYHHSYIRGVAGGQYKYQADVLIFHVREERFMLISLPEVEASRLPDDKVRSLGESRGCLQYIYIDEEHVKIWVLENNSSCTWILRHDICTEVLRTKILKFSCPIMSPVHRTRGFHYLEWLKQHRSGAAPFMGPGFASHPDKEAIFVTIFDTIFCYHLNDLRLEYFCSFVDPHLRRMGYSLVSFMYCLNDPDICRAVVAC